MPSPLHALRFRHAWRSYQERLLGALNAHLADGKLHLVAPPGAGKTSVGWEVVRRIGRPTLVLVPSLALREQWVRRLREDFLGGAGQPAWLSVDLAVPGFVTVDTYQAAHQWFSRKWTDEDEPHAWRALTDAGLGCLVVDEAHHLKRSWWDAIDDLCAVTAPTVVALTATPPYDVSGWEWARYDALAGPIDEEIAVAELVARDELAVHQDLLHLSLPAPEQRAALAERHAAVDALAEALYADADLQQSLLTWPAWEELDREGVPSLDWARGAFYSGVYLSATRNTLPEAAQRVLGVQVIPFDYGIAEGLLSFHFAETDLAEAYRPRLRQLKALRGTRVDLRQTESVRKLLARGGRYVRSVVEIAKHESAARGKALRMVCLVDFVREEWATVPLTPDVPVGAYPVLRALVDALGEEGRVGMLTGGHVVLPTEVAERLGYVGTPLLDNGAPHGKTHHAIVRLRDQERATAVADVTAAFQRGDLRVLVGTRALLGEGWDSPATNVLVLATRVGSFVTSNQLRGRALRFREGKVANVWHLACVDPADASGGEELARLRRRFLAFVGIGHDGAPLLSRSARRLALPQNLDDEAVAAYNERSVSWSRDLGRARETWTAAVQTDAAHLTAREVFPERDPARAAVLLAPVRLARRVTWAAWATTVAYAGVEAVLAYARWADRIGAAEWFAVLRVLAALGAALFLTQRLRRLFVASARERFVRSASKALAAATVEGLRAADVLGEGRGRMGEALRVELVEDTAPPEFRLLGGTRAARETAAGALAEVFGAVRFPRYFLRVEIPVLFGWVTLPVYLAVPKAVGGRKAAADAFAGAFREDLADVTVVNPRTATGRGTLVQAWGRG